MRLPVSYIYAVGSSFFVCSIFIHVMVLNVRINTLRNNLSVLEMKYNQQKREIQLLKKNNN
mgnify:CR=1 FL=1